MLTNPEKLARVPFNRDTAVLIEYKVPIAAFKDEGEAIEYGYSLAKQWKLTFVKKRHAEYNTTPGYVVFTAKEMPDHG